MLKLLPCDDSEEMARARKRELDIPRSVARELGASAVEAAREGCYLSESGKECDWGELVEAARRAKVGIPPDEALPAPGAPQFPETL